MPHLILEYSSNIREKTGFTDLFKTCHAILEKNLPTDITNCKSRAIMCSDFCVGQADTNNAFVHATLKVMSGRELVTLQATGNLLLKALQKYFNESSEQLNLQITLEIVELNEPYFK